MLVSITLLARESGSLLLSVEFEQFGMKQVIQKVQPDEQELS